MLKKPSISVIGGDTRQLYAAEYLHKEGYTVRLFACEHGKLPLKIKPSNSLKEALDSEVIILPLPVSKSAGLLNTPLSSDEYLLKDITEDITNKNFIYLGMAQQSLIKQISAKTDNVFDYYKDETLILKNAQLTSEGIISILLEKLPVSITGLRVAITGFGRIGFFTADLLNKLGAEVTVFARNNQQLTKAELLRNNAKHLSLLENFTNYFDCLINTIPYNIISEDFIKNVSSECLLIETASAPYGFDFNSCDKYNKRVIKAFSLPGKTVPKSAGIAIAQTIDNHLKEVFF